MQIVIDIPEDDYYDILQYAELKVNTEFENLMIVAIKNGTPLSKGHGRLIDADETLKKHCVDLCREKPSCHEDCLIYDLFHLAPTIIEAESEE